MLLFKHFILHRQIGAEKKMHGPHYEQCAMMSGQNLIFNHMQIPLFALCLVGSEILRGLDL